MRFLDLVGLSLFALSRHKLRTLLTALGVLFGTMVLVVSLSVRLGAQRTIVEQVSKHVELRRIEVRPKGEGAPADVGPVQGRMSDERRKRLRQELRRRNGGARAPSPEGRLTPERLQELGGLTHVVRVEPVVYRYGRVVLGDQSEHTSFVALPAEARDAMRRRLIAGTMLDEDDTGGALVSEMLLYNLGLVDEDDARSAVGRALRFEVQTGNRPAPTFLLSLLTGWGGKTTAGEEDLLGKVLRRLPESLDRLGLTSREQATLRRLLKAQNKKEPPPQLFHEQYTIRGILRAEDDNVPFRRGDWVWRQADLMLAPSAAATFVLRLPQVREQGFDQAVLEVDDTENVKSVQQEIRDMGLHADSAVEFIEREEFVYLIGLSAMSVVALIALVVAAIGITNTMLMSVLERVREIGIFKAVGARDGQVLALFLMEGALIGLVGGLLGLAAAWGISYPADAWARGQVAQRLHIELDGSLFAFPWWLLAGGPLFAVLVTTLAAFYPARRAVHIDPVGALRHE
jgi:putative ABC transport system permease protein